ncbi:hypothetical protein M885DRAFT_610256 [Pelagophyceae sp. CCMP2097]|nr:hypothetical protein M885DRAFT_610256 [Pelagophyceae sp. CCMP2097]
MHGARRRPWEAHASDPTERSVSARGLAKARGTVEDFVKSCFPLLGLPLEDVLAFGDVLYFVEASLYDADEANEAGESASLGALYRFLDGRGLLDAAVREELDNGKRYWALEHDLVAAWRMPPAGPDEEDELLRTAQTALRLKSFDYRVLLLITLRLVGRRDDPALLQLASSAFTLVEVEDDLKDYGADVASDAFNVYRAFTRRHRNDAPDRLLDWTRDLDAAYLDRRSEAKLDAQVLAAHLARNEQQEGAGPAMAPLSGRWSPPPVVNDEATFRLVARASGSVPRLFHPASTQSPSL